MTFPIHTPCLETSLPHFSFVENEIRTIKLGEQDASLVAHVVVPKGNSEVNSSRGTKTPVLRFIKTTRT